MRRRAFIAALGCAAAMPLVARAQQRPIPIIGCLTSSTASGIQQPLARLRQGLRDTGYIDGYNVVIEYDFQGTLAARTADLVRRQVTVILALGNVAAQAAYAATTDIPIVFQIGGDPVELGLAASFNHPGRNATGVSALTTESEAKRLEFLVEIAPQASVLTVLVNPKSATTDRKLIELQSAARILGRKLHILRASRESEIEAAIVVRPPLEALHIASDNFFAGQSERFATLTVAHRIPSVSAYRHFTEAGGLASYGFDQADLQRHVGRYVGRILQGEKPADLPVMQPTKFELVINLKTAKTLGITMPPTLLARADEVIE